MTQFTPPSFWDDRYGTDELAYGARASRLLMSYADKFAGGGSALVPACGQGRDAIFLAKSGLDVTGVDFSTLGLMKARKLAERFGAQVNWIEADLTQWDWPEAEYDVIANSFVHMQPEALAKFHDKCLAALKPGGLLFIEGFTPQQLDYQKSHNSGGPQDADMLFTEQSLGLDRDSCDMLSLWKGVEHLEEGKYHTGPAALLRAVFSKTGDA